MRFRARALFSTLFFIAVPAASQTLETGQTIRAMIFADAAYVATSREIPDGFLLGQLVGHLNAGLTDRLAFFGEVSATARPAGFNIEAERLILRYDFSDWFKLSLGRYHAPVSYWNTAFHHGAWLQTSVARPEMIKFGSQVIPVHFVGVLAEGSIPVNPLGLGYAIGLGNGRGSIIARAGDAGDVNDSRAWMASLFARPPALLGLQVGGSVYVDKVTPENGPEVDERILSAHLVLERETPEIAAEYARLLHEPTAGPDGFAGSDAGYVQLAYRLPGAAQAWKPYVRAERVRIAADDVLLAPLRLPYEAAIAGVRYDFAPYAALKAEYRNEQFADADRFNSLYLQVSFAIPAFGGGAPHAMHEASPAGASLRNNIVR